MPYKFSVKKELNLP